MAVALSGATLPAVVEELLSEMATAVQENAQSTGRRACVAALWAVDLARPLGRRGAEFAGPAGRRVGSADPALCSLRPGLSGFFSPMVLFPNLSSY